MRVNNAVFIPFQVPSSKNSKVAIKRGVFHSKTVQNYLRALGIQHFSSRKKEVKFYKTIPLLFPYTEFKKLFQNVEYPIVLGFHFVRSTKHRFDFHNAVQLPLDILTAFELIPDDDMEHIIPQCYQIEDRYHSYDKDNPGVYIKIIK